MSKKPSWTKIESKLPLFQKSTIESIENIPSHMSAFKTGVKKLAAKNIWLRGDICKGKNIIDFYTLWFSTTLNGQKKYCSKE